jgi:hypothetical protein
MGSRLAALVVLATALAGCGLGAGDDQDGAAQLRVTRDFGQRELATASRDPVKEGDTVMRFLQSERKVSLRYGGGFVQSIDGLSGEGATGRRDWFYWVNGQEASVGAAERRLRAGDVVQWDYRDWGATMSIPAIVGAYPEPLVHGIEGKRLPVRVECPDDAAQLCRTARDQLSEAGVKASSASVGQSERGQVLRVFVGQWSDLRVGARILRTVEQGPEASGVFARFRDDGTRLDLLDARGEVARTAGPGTGLVAALRVGEDEGISFVVTGTDAKGVDAAIGALDARTLRDAFAVAVTGDRAVTKLPVLGGGGS